MEVWVLSWNDEIWDIDMNESYKVFTTEEKAINYFQTIFLPFAKNSCNDEEWEDSFSYSKPYEWDFISLKKIIVE